MSKKAQRKDEIISDLTNKLVANGHAKKGPSQRKNWSPLDIKANIKPLNLPQRDMFRSYFENNHVIGNGSAGTGKTFAAVYLALTKVLSKEHDMDRIIIVRSTVASREMGHLPGTEEEKMAPYENPYRDIFNHIIGSPNTYDDMKKAGIVQFMTTSFVRGLTWDDAVIVVDEVQNMNFHEINSIVTRVGVNSQLLVLGDHIQTDLYRQKNDKTGIEQFLRVARNMKEFDEVIFTKNDIIRSEFVKSWLTALEEDCVDLMGELKR